jgi:hypothetical protein
MAPLTMDSFAFQRPASVRGLPARYAAVTLPDLPVIISVTTHTTFANLTYQLHEPRLIPVRSSRVACEVNQPQWQGPCMSVRIKSYSVLKHLLIF